MIYGTVEYKYPYVAKLKKRHAGFFEKDKHIFVMFISKNTGVVLIDEDPSPFSLVGTYKADWEEESFAPMSSDEKLIIGNKKS